MKFLRSAAAVLVLAAALLFSGCHWFSRSNRPSGPAVTGSVVYITNVQLPANATIALQLVELDANGAVVQVVAQDVLPRPPKVPVAFRLPYDKSLIHRRAHYGLIAKILAGERTIFAAPRPTPVLTRGNPPSAEIVVEPVR